MISILHLEYGTQSVSFQFARSCLHQNTSPHPLKTKRVRLHSIGLSRTELCVKVQQDKETPSRSFGWLTRILLIGRQFYVLPTSEILHLTSCFLFQLQLAQLSLITLERHKKRGANSKCSRKIGVVSIFRL